MTGRLLCAGWFCFVASGLVQAQEKLPQPAKFDTPIAAETLRKHVEYLASPELEGRGTAKGKQAALKYLREQFEDIGLQPLFPEGSFIQNIPGKEQEGKPTTIGRNIGGWITGSDPKLKDEFIILSAHFDHLGIRNGKVYPGADDNAGSVAEMLEIAREMNRAKVKPKRSVVFLSCDLEENLLWGSRWFVAHAPWPLKQIKLFITTEMIGRMLGNLPMNTIFVLGAEHGAGLQGLVESLGTPSGLDTAYLGIDLIGTRSDYGPFKTEKVPFLFFSGGEHPDYHQPTDTADRVDYSKVANVSNLVLKVVRKAADAEKAPEWVDEPKHDLSEVRTLYRITDLLLKTDDKAREAGKAKLTDLQRFTVSNVQAQIKQALDRGEAKPGERQLLIRGAQMLLLTVF